VGSRQRAVRRGDGTLFRAEHSPTDGPLPTADCKLFRAEQFSFFTITNEWIKTYNRERP